MLLLIDAGNTLIKWAIAPAYALTIAHTSWIDTGKTPHGEIESLSTDWQKRYSDLTIRRVFISSVAGEGINQSILNEIGQLQSQPDVVWFSSVSELAGVTNTYANANRLGSDRFASLIGARYLFPNENLVVVTCGTATTIDTLTSDGVFLGGMILPGLRLMANSLFGNTAQLPDIGQMTENIPPFAIDTTSAIRNGCMTAQVGAIEHAVSVHAKHLRNVRCVLSGGAAELIKPYLSIPAQIVDNLVLVGLHAAYADQGSMN